MIDSYDFPTKELYRNRRESAINRLCKKSPGLRRVAYLDTGEALDTESYLRHGYQAKNLFPINSNPAHAAHITMKMKEWGYEDFKSIGLDFNRALFERVPEVDIIDFDGMGPLNSNLQIRILDWILHYPRLITCVTIQAAREIGVYRDNIIETQSESNTFHTSFNTPVNRSNFNRIALLALTLSGGSFSKVLESGILKDDFEKRLREEGRPLNTSRCFIHLDRLFWDIYKSKNHVSMLWSVSRHEPHHHLTIKESMKIIKNRGTGHDLESYYGPFCLHERHDELENWAKNRLSQRR